MKITGVSCTQFAGVRDLDVSLADGLNVIYGKNESGKSTLVNLISRTLFQSVKQDRRKDRDFIDSFFPAARKGVSRKADSVDGELTLETENGTCTLTKEWGADPRCVLKTPDEVIRDSETAAAVLKETLVYGEGVYANMLLSSQRNADESLRTILDASGSGETKNEIAAAVSRAFAESGGISVDAVGQAIRAKIEEIAGRHWDPERQAPARHAGRWTKELGTILKAYYALEDAENVLAELTQLEEKADRAAAGYAEKNAAFGAAEAACSRFGNYAGALTVQNDCRKEIRRLSGEIEKAGDVLSRWPALAAGVKRAGELEKELEDREACDIYRDAKALSDVIAEESARLSALLCPSKEEIAEAARAARQMEILAGKLCGMNISAAIRMSDGAGIEIRSLRTGEEISFSDTVTITEAVRITVPGVMEMELSPADVDTASVRTRLDEQKEIINRIFAEYGVQSQEELEELSREYEDSFKKVSDARFKLQTRLGALSFDEVETAAQKVVAEPRRREEITAGITAVCGGRRAGDFIAAGEAALEMYEREYTGIEQLKERISELQADQEKAREKVSAIREIPEEFKDIADPQAHLSALSEALESARKAREEALVAKTKAASDLEARNDMLTGDPAEDAERAEREFEEQKALLAHWNHIAEVFAEEREKIFDNPLADLAENFARCLAVLSDGRVVSEFRGADKLDLDLYSAGRLIDYGKLSEGTKETVSLAFRLAVLDHLFPDGGGVVVLDDPFANMDADRTAQAVKLVKECAGRHQVILLTCKEGYRGMLGGNYIEMA